MPGLRRPGFFNPRTPTSRPAWLHFRYRATAGIAGSGLEPLVVVFGQAVTGTSEPRRWLSKGSPRDRHGHSTATPPARCRRRVHPHFPVWAVRHSRRGPALQAFARPLVRRDRKGVAEGRSGAVRVAPGGGRDFKINKRYNENRVNK